MEETVTSDKILNLLATHLGVDKDDIGLEDTFSELNMSSIDLADFAHTLNGEGYDITPEEIAVFKTPAELAEFLSQEDL